MEDPKEIIARIAARKAQERRAAARLPIEEKFRILEELHELGEDIAKLRASARASMVLATPGTSSTRR